MESSKSDRGKAVKRPPQDKAIDAPEGAHVTTSDNVKVEITKDTTGGGRPEAETK